MVGRRRYVTAAFGVAVVALALGLGGCQWQANAGAMGSRATGVGAAQAAPDSAATPAGSQDEPTPATDPTPTTALTDNVAESAGDGVAATGESGSGPPLGGVDVGPTAEPATTKQASDQGAAAQPVAKRTRVIALDPGHGGPEPGASAPGLAEKDLNLKIALKLADLLNAESYRVVLTRDSDRSAIDEYTGGGYPAVGRDLQTRIDIANAAEADLFLSIHNNGSADPGQAGTEVWYNRQRTFADRNLVLATLLQEALVSRIRELGYPDFDRGIKDDSAFRIFQGRAYNIYVLGPGEGPRAHTPTRMPAALGESMILSNPGDAAMLRKDSTLDAIAAGYRDAIDAYFAQFPE